jgi:hypothetical protein
MTTANNQAFLLSIFISNEAEELEGILNPPGLWSFLNSWLKMATGSIAICFNNKSNTGAAGLIVSMTL